MKWFRSSRPAVYSALFGGAVLVAAVNTQVRAEVSGWLKHLEAGSIQDVFFRTAAWPNGAVRVRRPPRETRPALDALISASPSNAALYRLRAGEAELQLDFAAAQADWEAYARTTADRAEGQLALAEFYHRRLQPADEFRVLRAAAQLPGAPSEALTPAAEQRSWRTFDQMLHLIRAAQLPRELIGETYRDWIARYPKEPAPYVQYFEYLRDQRQFEAAERQIEAYRNAFPDDRIYPFTARADLEMRRGNAGRALSLYEREFRPLWPAGLVSAYFDLLEKSGRLRSDLAADRSAYRKDPGDLRVAARLFFALRKLGNDPAARKVLVDFRLNKEARHVAWSAEELVTLARLFEEIQDPNECIRQYYALYSLPAASAPERLQALAGIANVLLTSPEEPIHFGAGDLSLYRDIAAADPYPGYLNGILSLLLNSELPRSKLAEQERVSVAYFHRARAAELVQLFDRQFPAAAERAGLHARLIEAYAVYGDSDGVIRQGRYFLAGFPSAAERTSVALAMADAYARKGQTLEEFALYEQLLKELAAKSGGVPLGRGAKVPAAARSAQPPDEPAGAPGAAVLSADTAARSPEYARVLDRYISRLVSMDRVMDALKVCSGEISRNPDDPGLYERLAAFLDQNRLGGQVEGVYRKAMDRFPDPSWTHKLARWYLRRQRSAEFEKLTEDVIKAFSGTDLEAYFRELVNSSALGPAAYRQVNLYAHQRFPNNLQFVRNLLDVYSRRETYDARASRELLRQYWFYDDQLRQQFFSHYADEEQKESQALRARAGNAAQLAAADPWGARLVAEMAAWRSHFEEAAPAFEALASQYAGDPALALRAAAVYRSLAAYQPGLAVKAVALVENAAKYNPRGHDILTQAGEILADREQYSLARQWWNRITQTEPGSAEGYLEAATVFWDYFQFDDALRVLAEGRRKLSDPSLHSYQAGAIYENKGDNEHAVREYVQSVLARGSAADETSPARARLLLLARRASSRPVIEAQTAAIAGGRNPETAAVGLRVAILERQNRRAEIGALLLSLSASADSPQLLDYLSGTAARLGLEDARAAVLKRQIALASDSVERIRLQLALARYFESKPDVQTARSTIEEVLRTNQEVLGVVRAATDFYWRNHLAEQAIDTLVAAARLSNARFQKEFTFEAVRKATEAGKYARARELLTGLLAAEPYNSDYLAAMAGAYAQAGEYAQLRDFYSARIADVNRAPFPAAERMDRVARLRRGLIPALERLGEHAAAIDQYIEIINRYPQDENLVKDASLFAARHRLQSRLAGYYVKASAESPKDVRLHVALARVQTYLEDYAAAVSTYERAIGVRPDRLDLRIAQAGLLERLTRFDQAIEAYRSIYELSYRDPQWLLKVGELLAREGKPQEAARAVEGALIEGRPERPSVFFEAAVTVEKWGMLPEAAVYVARGVEAAGPRLFIDQARGAELYARIMTRLQRHEEAFRRLGEAAQAGMKLPQQEAISWSAALAMREIGRTAKVYFTPEEKVALAAFLEKARTNGNPPGGTAAMLQLAEAAGLKEREVRWRFDLLMAEPDAAPASEHLRRIVGLQEARLQFAELGSQLERYWRAKSERMEHLDLLEQAARAYAKAGDTENEFRVLSLNPGGSMLPRYLDLLRQRDPDRARKLAAGSYAGMSAALESGDAAFAKAAVLAGAKGPVWTRAHLGLVGLYYRDAGEDVRNEFAGLLGGGTIGERLGKPVNRDEQLAGESWFYFGSRYGEYLAVTNRQGAEDYLPAVLEAAPARSSAYFALAQSYEEAGMHDRAIAEYQDGLQFDRNAGEAFCAIADILWEQGKQEEATAQYRLALEAFRRQENAGRVPPEFWNNVERTLDGIARYKILVNVRREADALLHDYIRINGSYRAEPLLRGAMAAAGTPDSGVNWILDLSRALRTAPESAEFLNQMLNSTIPEDQQEPVLARIVEIWAAETAQKAGEARVNAEAELDRHRLNLAWYLANRHRTDRARAIAALLPNRPADLEIVIAAQSGELQGLLNRYRQDPAHAPSKESLQNAASRLHGDRDRAPERAVLEYLYSRELDAQELTAPNFLGLAQIRLENGDLQAAIALLRRMNLVSSEPFENLTAAADLLERAGHKREAAEFLATRGRAVPWDEDAQLRLAVIRGDTRAIAAVASKSGTAYETRVRAAAALSANRATVNTGSGELDLLAAGNADAGAAEKPLYYEARVRAAAASKDPAVRIRLLMGAMAIDPESETVRLSLVGAALDGGKERLAIAAAGPILPRWWGRDDGVDSDDDMNSWVRMESQRFLNSGGRGAVERSELVQRLAQAAQHSGDLAMTERLLRIVRYIHRSPQLDARLAAVSLERNRLRQNLVRRPAFNDGIKQPAVVRPMLAAAKREAL